MEQKPSLSRRITCSFFIPQWCILLLAFYSIFCLSASKTCTAKPSEKCLQIPQNVFPTYIFSQTPTWVWVWKPGTYKHYQCMQCIKKNYSYWSDEQKKWRIGDMKAKCHVHIYSKSRQSIFVQFFINVLLKNASWKIVQKLQVHGSKLALYYHVVLWW